MGGEAVDEAPGDHRARGRPLGRAVGAHGRAQQRRVLHDAARAHGRQLQQAVVHQPVRR